MSVLFYGYFCYSWEEHSESYAYFVNKYVMKHSFPSVWWRVLVLDQSSALFRLSLHVNQKWFQPVSTLYVRMVQKWKKPYLSVIFENQRRVAKLPIKRGNICWAMEWRHEHWIGYCDLMLCTFCTLIGTLLCIVASSFCHCFVISFCVLRHQ